MGAIIAVGICGTVTVVQPKYRFVIIGAVLHSVVPKYKGDSPALAYQMLPGQHHIHEGPPMAQLGRKVGL